MLNIATILGQGPSALGTTLALLITFLGIGVLVNALIAYIVAQVMVERRQNQERQQSFEA
jgi:phage shock protein PspC (stress-responsive transcriptional regulator)